MATTKIDGQLEIDSDRGVIYFHTSDSKWTEKFQGITILRICSLPTPIPIEEPMLDITHMFGTSWGGKLRMKHDGPNPLSGTIISGSSPPCLCPALFCPVHGELDKAELRKGRKVRKKEGTKVTKYIIKITDQYDLAWYFEGSIHDDVRWTNDQNRAKKFDSQTELAMEAIKNNITTYTAVPVKE